MVQQWHESVAFVGNYLPRRCGIATFMTDLCERVQAEHPRLDCLAVAINDAGERYAYPERVRFEICEERLGDYNLAADFLNVHQVDVVCVQHEFGIFGGDSGQYLLPLLRQVRARVVTTLHTVLAEPSAKQREVMKELSELSDFMIVMSPRAKQYGEQIYGIPSDRLRVIHHGIPDMPFVDPNYFKDRFNAEGRRVLMTFGLLSPGKGIEYVIEALPEVVKQFPDVLYLILGATHPHVKRESGEQYRSMLQRLVREKRLENHVLFLNRFVDQQELCEYIGATDIYVTPYLNPAQIVSGTLAYALGTGKAVVSTPYWYAEDMLSEGRGRLVPFANSGALANTVVELLTDEPARHAMRKRAYQFGRAMTWASVARQYVEIFAEAATARERAPRRLNVDKQTPRRPGQLPELNLRHFLNMTDSVGIFQHARFDVPNPHHGYSTDDQARALVVVTKASKRFPQAEDWKSLASRYLSFLLHAFDPESRRFSNFLSFQRQWVIPIATEDVHARSIWALSHVAALSDNKGHRSLAMQLLGEAIPPTTSFSSPRSWAIALLGILVYLRRYSGASAFRRECRDLGGLLVKGFDDYAVEEWPWLEEELTYGNGRIAQALIEGGEWLEDSTMLNWGLKSLDWLDRIQTGDDGHFIPIGTEGWYRRGEVKSRFDQQPIEAYTMLDACFSAYRITSDSRWLASAGKAFDWFIGRNDLGVPVHDFTTGGCFDGLHPDRVNQNQGAESTIVWLLSLLSMYELEEMVSVAPPYLPKPS